MNQRHFEYVFDDESERGRITFDFSEQDSERPCVLMDGNEAVVYANRAGFMALAKLCIKFAMGSYQPGFHIHLREDFSGDAVQADQLRLALVDDQ